MTQEQMAEELMLGHAQAFILTDILPENVAKPFLQKADELKQKLMQCLEPKLKRECLANHLKKLDLTLPEKYSSSLESNTDLIYKLVQTSTEMLATRGVKKKVEEVVLPFLEIQQFSALLSKPKINCGIQLDV